MEGNWLLMLTSLVLCLGLGLALVTLTRTRTRAKTGRVAHLARLEADSVVDGDHDLGVGKDKARASLPGSAPEWPDLAHRPLEECMGSYQTMLLQAGDYPVYEGVKLYSSRMDYFDNFVKRFDQAFRRDEDALQLAVVEAEDLPPLDFQAPEPGQPADMVLEVETEAETAYDGYDWSDRGYKKIKHEEFRRYYYHCKVAGCLAKKNVQRSQDNPKVLIVTYRGSHKH